MSVFDIAQARLAAVKNTDAILARQREQAQELEMLRERQNVLLLNGSSNLWEEVLQHERELIRFALRAANKSVTRAATMLGVKYQTLAHVIESRHPELIPERSEIHRRVRA